MTRPWRLGRREFLRSLGLAGALLLAPGIGAQRLPRTGFERSGDRAWTSEDDEAALLAALASRSSRVAVAAVGRSRTGRPVRLARVGAARGPAVLFVCAQHGHEPASREAALELLRDLAFTSDPVVLAQLRHQAVLAIPTANPDGRAAGTRGNGAADLNRDHLALDQPETRALHAALRAWSPDVVVDLHEYRPPDATRFHHDLLYLWPRNLNVDPRLRALSQALGAAVARGARGAGLTADQYGRAARQAAMGPDPALPGGGDEAILRNAAGLSHRLGLLVETAVTLEGDAAGHRVTALRARVQAQRRVMEDVLGFLRRHGQRAHAACGAASRRRAAAGATASRPVFFGGADDHPPAPAEVADPPPCRYRVDSVQAERLAGVFALHGVRAEPAAGAAVAVPMAQPAASLVPLLLDPRARRALAAGRPAWCVSG